MERNEKVLHREDTARSEHARRSDWPERTASERRFALINPNTNGGRRTLRILLVEDHEDTARVMTRVLTRDGHGVTAAATVATAKEKLDSQPFDLLLCDIGLPDGTGFDVVRLAKAQRSLRSIALTGFAMEEDIELCAEAGFDNHLTKPVNFQALEQLLREITDGCGK